MSTKIVSLLVFIFAVLSPSLQAQKFGYIDADFIITQMPQYPKVLEEIDKAALAWQQEVETKFREVEQTRQKYLQDEILLTDDMKSERLEALAKQEKEAREYQQKVFGYKGLFYQKRQDLMQTVQEELYQAVSKVARKNKIQIMFNKSSDLIMLYHEPRHDYTEEVLEALGINDED
ncbi:OmpH family outer membrane protein [Eisenibacter elegans]|uniref:OmpH family outer membrane protein n=1 Tax=Eisenibacter elegans TaxID=997 RepID=UPI0003FDC261|nr:OmpH family outer membrane protein [Eisenibacter elegans]